jgi:hypothetical protein
MQQQEEQEKTLKKTTHTQIFLSKSQLVLAFAVPKHSLEGLVLVCGLAPSFECRPRQISRTTASWLGFSRFASLFWLGLSF